MALISVPSSGSTSPRLAPASPAAARIRPPSWRDARLLVGVLLILASVALGARVVAAVDRTEPVLAAVRTLPTGHVLEPGDLTVVRARLDGVGERYLRAGQAPAAGSVLRRTVGQGELLPAQAVGLDGAVDRRPVHIPFGPGVPVDLAAGDRVDLWSSARDPAAGGSGYRPPVALARAAEVVGVRLPDSSLGSQLPGGIQVLLSEADLREVLDALANGARLAAVALPGPARQAAR